MKNTVKALAAAAVMSLLTANSYAAPATEKTVRELMKLTGSADMGIKMMEAMIPRLKKIVPQVPESFWVELAKEMDADELIEVIVPIYVKHFSEEELQEVVKFYRSPAGRSVLEKLPLVVQESMVVGEEWGQQLAAKIVEKAKKAQAELKLY